MKIGNTLIMVTFFVASSLSLACPNGQHSQCVVPRPWPAHGCAQSVCVGNIIPAVPTDPESIFATIKDKVLQTLVAAVTPTVTPAARSAGWSIDSCVGVGTGAILAATYGYSEAICMAAGATTGPGGAAVVPTCDKFIMASGGVIVGLVCTSLCSKHVLKDGLLGKCD